MKQNYNWLKLHGYILEPIMCNIAPQIDSYVNGQSNYFNCFVCAIVTILKVKNKFLGAPKPLNTTASHLGFTWALDWTGTGLEQNLNNSDHKWLGIFKKM